ncbi:helix-turn-helix transcriptional regulator [Serratia fonticola]|uniref:helix-turn-helix transcriptional regulator n=2 Tax=Serratia TaxID=613 RepID=UPI0009D71294|nr:LuxR C-terminal-related transcriptional regulator [Serratia fonticola]
MSMVIMLDHFYSNIILLPYDSNTRKVASYFPLPSADKVDVESMKKAVKESIFNPSTKIWKLTYKEAVTLSYRLQGMSIYEVNSLFSVSIKTVYAHQRKALSKIGVKTIAHLHRLGESLPEMYRPKAQ